MATVVVMPVLLCPTCSSSLYQGNLLSSNGPAPDYIVMRCLNGRCEECGVRKQVPLTRLEVTVCDDDPE